MIFISQNEVMYVSFKSKVAFIFGRNKNSRFFDERSTRYLHLFKESLDKIIMYNGFVFLLGKSEELQKMIFAILKVTRICSTSYCSVVASSHQNNIVYMSRYFTKNDQTLFGRHLWLLFVHFSLGFTPPIGRIIWRVFIFDTGGNPR